MSRASVYHRFSEVLDMWRKIFGIWRCLNIVIFKWLIHITVYWESVLWKGKHLRKIHHLFPSNSSTAVISGHKPESLSLCCIWKLNKSWFIWATVKTPCWKIPITLCRLCPKHTSPYFDDKYMIYVTTALCWLEII